MSNKFFADSLFVSYIKGIPSNERIPYLQRESVTQEIVNRLTDQILSGIVCSVQLDDETKENSLVADFREGWSTVYIVNIHTPGKGLPHAMDQPGNMIP